MTSAGRWRRLEDEGAGARSGDVPRARLLPGRSGRGRSGRGGCCRTRRRLGRGRPAHPQSDRLEDPLARHRVGPDELPAVLEVEQLGGCDLADAVDGENARRRRRRRAAHRRVGCRIAAPRPACPPPASRVFVPRPAQALSLAGPAGPGRGSCATTASRPPKDPGVRQGSCSAPGRHRQGRPRQGRPRGRLLASISSSVAPDSDTTMRAIALTTSPSRMFMTRTPVAVRPWRLMSDAAMRIITPSRLCSMISWLSRTMRTPTR